MKSRYGWLSLLCLALLIACQSTPHNPMTLTLTPTDQPAWQLWLSSSTPNAVLSLAVQEDHLWVGTRFGLWQIDTAAKRVLRHDLLLGEVHQLLPVENGQLWAAGSAGLFFFDGTEWHRIDPLVGISHYHGSIMALAIDATGDLWLVAEVGRGVSTFHYQGHLPVEMKFLPLDSDRGNAPNLWPPDCQQISVYESSHFAYHTSEECRALQNARQRVPLESDIIFPQLTIDAQGSLWWMEASTLQRSVNGVVTDWDLRTNTLKADPTQGIWIGTNQGLSYTDGSAWHEVSLPAQPYRLDVDPVDLAVDSSGRVWMLTNTGQIVWQQPDQSLRFSYEMASAVHAMAAAPEGGLWMTHGSDLAKLNSPTPLIQPITGTRLEHLMIDPAGNVWAITDGGSALQYRPDADQWIRHLLTKPAPLEAELDPIQQIVASADGTVYAVGLSGLGELTAAGDLITATAALTTTALPYPAHRHRALFPLADALANRPDALRNSQSATAPHGGIWLAIIDQPDLWHYAKGRVTMLAHPLNGRDVLGLYIDQRGWLWEVGNGQQLAVYDGQNWRTIAMPDLGTVKRIAGAPDGRLWFVGERGVAVYDPGRDTTP